jgi:hypothetical protein
MCTLRCTGRCADHYDASFAARQRTRKRVQAARNYDHLKTAAPLDVAAGLARPKSNTGNYRGFTPVFLATDRAAGADTAGLRILLAEDNIMNRRLISRILEKMGHTVAVANDGATALGMLAQQEFDLISHGYANAANGWARSDTEDSPNRSRHGSSYSHHRDYRQRV